MVPFNVLDLPVHHLVDLVGTSHPFGPNIILGHLFSNIGGIQHLVRYRNCTHRCFPDLPVSWVR